jgi:tRNA pseudouridine55 synthase
VFAVDKPAGMTSHDVVARVRRVLPGAKVGHAGTLDPDATGVLVICVGKATKISAFLMEGEKEYRGVGRLGITTDSQDASGEVVLEREVAVDEAAIRDAARAFVGRIEQIPPMYSAVKIGGQKLYRLARKGVVVERPARPVVIHELEIGEVNLPDFEFRLRSSKGTYVRTLVHDLGEVLGCGAHLLRLARTSQGGFDLASAVPFETLGTAGAAESIRAARRSPGEALEFLPVRRLTAVSEPLRAGARIPADRLEEGPQGVVRLGLPGGGIAGIATVDEEGARLLHLFPPGSPWGRGRRSS